MNTNDFIICIRWEQTTWNTAAMKGFIALDYWDWHHSWQWNYDQTRVKLEAGGRSRDFENKFRSNMKDVELQKNLSTATQNTRVILNISWGWGDGQKVQEDSYKCWEKAAENEGCECGISVVKPCTGETSWVARQGCCQKSGVKSWKAESENGGSTGQE